MTKIVCYTHSDIKKMLARIHRVDADEVITYRNHSLSIACNGENYEVEEKTYLYEVKTSVQN